MKVGQMIYAICQSTGQSHPYIVCFVDEIDKSVFAVSIDYQKWATPERIKIQIKNIDCLCFNINDAYDNPRQMIGDTEKDTTTKKQKEILKYCKKNGIN